jgi:hypothetical protein
MMEIGEEMEHFQDENRGRDGTYVQKIKPTHGTENKAGEGGSRDGVEAENRRRK